MVSRLLNESYRVNNLFTAPAVFVADLPLVIMMRILPFFRSKQHGNRFIVTNGTFLTHVVLQDWEGIELNTVPYKDSGTCIIGSVDDVQAILDDQIVKVQAINASPFVAPFQERSSTHESCLMTLQVQLVVALP